MGKNRDLLQVLLLILLGMFIPFLGSITLSYGLELKTILVAFIYFLVFAKALALGADAVAIGQGILFALVCNHESYFQDGRHCEAAADYAKIGTAPGFCHHWPYRALPGGHHHPG